MPMSSMTVVRCARVSVVINIPTKNPKFCCQVNNFNEGRQRRVQTSEFSAFKENTDLRQHFLVFESHWLKSIYCLNRICPLPESRGPSTGGLSRSWGERPHKYPFTLHQT